MAMTKEGAALLANIVAGKTDAVNFYFYPFTGSGTESTSIDAAALAASFPESIAYASTSRVPWTPTVSTDAVMSNASSAGSIVFNAAAMIHGQAIVTGGTKGDAIGTVIAVEVFDTNKSFASGESLSLIHSLTFTPEA